MKQQIQKLSRHHALERAVEERYTADLHNLVVKNKAWLQTAFDWAQHVGSEEDTRRNVQSNQMLHQRGYAKMFLIFKMMRWSACCRSTD
jgi:ribosomal-protein-serine acetyltransferase